MIGFEYYRPDNLKMASEMLVKKGIYTHVLNGGTDLIERIKKNYVKADILVDIKGISELSKIEYDEKKGLTIGACITLEELLENSIIKEKYRILIDSLESIGTNHTRKRGTVIGNMCNESYLGDSLTTLSILGTTIRVYSYLRGERELKIEDFLIWTGTNCLKRGEIVKSIHIPVYSKIDGGFLKIYKNDEKITLINMSVGKMDESYRLSFYMPGSIPVRIHEVEDYLINRKISEYDIYKIAKMTENKIMEKDSFGLIGKKDMKQIKDLMKYIFKAFSKRENI